MQIVGAKSDAIIVVSCVTVESPHRPHPHSIVGKECTDGVCRISLSVKDNMQHSFQNIGIQCVKKTEIDDALRKRREINVDPFGSKYLVYN